MQRVCLAFLRFCLAAWVGIATFFVMVVMGLRQSELFNDAAKFNHPKILFPLYYSFEFATLGTALVCTLAGMGNARIARARRFAALVFVGAAVGLALWDYAVVYRTLADMMAANVLPAEFKGLHEQSRWLNAAVLGFSTIAAILALWPETLNGAGNQQLADRIP